MFVLYFSGEWMLMYICVQGEEANVIILGVGEEAKKDLGGKGNDKALVMLMDPEKTGRYVVNGWLKVVNGLPTQGTRHGMRCLVDCCGQIG